MNDHHPPLALLNYPVLNPFAQLKVFTSHSIAQPFPAEIPQQLLHLLSAS